MLLYTKKVFHPGGESNPGLMHDKRGCFPLNYRGVNDDFELNAFIFNFIFYSNDI